MHFWDVGKGSYALPPGSAMGAVDGRELPRQHLFGEYQSTIADGHVVKSVHVSAVSAPAEAVNETRWIDTLASTAGFPSAIIGTVDLGGGLPAIATQLDQQMESSLFRGIRLLSGIDYGSDLGAGVIGQLADRALVYDVVAHPGGVSEVAKAAGRFPAVSFVMEHMGWPLSTDDHHFVLWRDEMTELASHGNAYCKLSGLAMTFHAFATERFRRYFDHCLDIFGADRCMFGSNFPVDGLYGSYAELRLSFVTLTQSLSSDEQAKIYGGTAERVYRV
jgi:predicted TIM-barrel fold metal-dependent hydrolase